MISLDEIALSERSFGTFKMTDRPSTCFMSPGRLATSMEKQDANLDYYPGKF
jgi:hypothetical protein